MEQQPFLADVVDRVTRALDRAGRLEKPARARIQEVGVEVGVGLAKVSATIARGESSQASSSAALVGPVEDFFHTASHLVRDAGGAGLLVIIDELHAPCSPAMNAREPRTPARGWTPRCSSTRCRTWRASARTTRWA